MKIWPLTLDHAVAFAQEGWHYPLPDDADTRARIREWLVEHVGVEAGSEDLLIGRSEALDNLLHEYGAPTHSNGAKLNFVGRTEDLLRALIEQRDAAVRAADFRPSRADDVAAWIKRQRDLYSHGDEHWDTLNTLLDEYRLHADTGTPLTERADT